MKVMDKDGNVIDEWTSEKDKPHVIKRLVVGETYTLHEEFAPYGYLKATDVTFTVKDTAEVQKVEMKDEVPKGLLIINKKGEFLEKITLLDNVKGTVEHFFEYITGNLSEVTFEVYAAEDIKAADGVSADHYKKDELVGTITTDEKGIAKMEDLPVGKYYVKEVKTAHGFVLDGEPRFVDLTYRDQDTPVVTFDEEWQNNRQKIKVTVLKKEKDTERMLEGAIFGLFTKEDIKGRDGKVLMEAGTLIEQKTTDENGQILFKADLPVDGIYIVKEIYVVTDPKGTIIVECGKMLVNGGYRIKVLNTINFKKSMHYNPFHYIRSEKDILKLVNTIIANTKGEGEKSTEDFWIKAERLLYSALIGYIWYEAPEEEQNFSTLLEFINASETREDDEEFKNAVDELFEELEAENPEHFAVRQYRKYKLAAGKTAKSILISCGARLAPFDIQELREIMSYDEMELDMIGDQKTAMFVIISDTDDTFNFVVAIMYTQLFNLLCDKADDEHGGRLPYHVRLLLDEFSNIGQIPKFDKLIATIRSREISASIILQSQSQLKTIYKDAAETITGNCDTVLFLGGKESSTLKEISETLGKETIDLYNTSDTRGTSQSYGLNYQKTGKELMSRDELAVMDGNKCILQLRGVPSDTSGVAYTFYVEANLTFCKCQ